MPRSSNTSRPSTPAAQDPCYPDDLLPELQATLAALADVEVRYEGAREHLQAWEGPEAIRQHLLAQLEERHQREREPHVGRLADLQYRIMRLMAFEDICATA
ncbi:hypothetical protein KBI52_21965 [Microvirga sp. HBU67558]|uniref:hypothetical protein n=1 Tax=Microvirga TaxID=186650 RepID=UPI001B39A578|nr:MULTISPECIES: hypothetical protein [unclassified Microvirga]MBQ0822858.1 hypothetical protein [Microvirga sp. HBU67558]